MSLLFLFSGLDPTGLGPNEACSRRGGRVEGSRNGWEHSLQSFRVLGENDAENDVVPTIPLDGGS